MGRTLTVSALKVRQPIGDFYICIMAAKDLVEISWSDVRRMSDEGGEVDTYLGVQRRISPSRVGDLRRYVRTFDATFPTSIIVAARAECTYWDESKNLLRLSEFEAEGEDELDVPYGEIAKILDGQHRLRAFAQLEGQQFMFDFDSDVQFDLPVAVFVGADLAQQANILATVNLAQTKVNKSLVYDLAELSKARSPQKSAHYVAVALDQTERSPFYESIKRLGVATPGRGDFKEVLTQAAVVESLLYYITKDTVSDREFYLRNPGGRLSNPDARESDRFIFRRLFIEEKEDEIAKIVWAYFDAAKERWGKAWADDSRGNIIRRTNGFRAFMKALRPIYNMLLDGAVVGSFVSRSKFSTYFDKLDIADDEFTSDVFPPGSSGESQLRKRLLSGLE